MPRVLKPPVRRRVTHATDAIKMACPFCGASESSVVRSTGALVANEVLRRRECAACHNRFPTSERVDLDRLFAELEARVRATAPPPV